MNRTTRIKITELNPHVICVLCGGYFINATTIVECLHSFCRTCITRYLETSKYCPVCDVMVHKTRPLEYIRSDKTLQDLVYKLVPGLYKNEMKRRREYYSQHDPPGVSPPPSEDRGDEFHDRIIYTEDEKISLSLELCAEGIPFKTPSAIHGHSGPGNIKIKDVRYLHCPAAFSVGNLKKFIRMKFDLKMKYEIDIFHTAEPLPDYYTLMDIAYIYTWTRRAPVRLFYTVYERKLSPKTISEELRNLAKSSIPKDSKPMPIVDEIKKVVDSISVAKPAIKPKKDKLESKKRKLLQGPDDISPDLNLEKSRPHHRKEGVARKRAKKQLVVDSLVLEAMSESEEQLAKLTLNSSIDESGSKAKAAAGGVDIDKLNDNSVPKIDDTNEGFNTAEVNVTDIAKDTSSNDCDRTNAKSDITHANKTVRNGVGGSLSSKSDDLKVDTGADGSAATSDSVSPGSISLSLFQPLNTGDQEKKDSEKLYEFTCERTSNQQSTENKPKPKRGRKPKSEKVDDAKETAKQNNELINSESDDKVNTSVDPPPKKIVKKEKSKDTDVPVDNSDSKPVKSTKPKKVVDTKIGANGEKVKRKYVRKNPKKALLQTENNETKESETCDVTCSSVISGDGKADESSQPENVADTVENASESLKLNHKCSETVVSIVKDNLTNFDSRNTAGENVVKVNGCDPEKQTGKSEVSTISGPVAEPLTPPYGKTPKVTELSEGVPVSPVPECAEKGALVNGADGEVSVIDSIGANRILQSKHESQKAASTIVSNKVKSNVETSTVKCSSGESSQKTNVSVMSCKRPILPHPVYKPISASHLVNANGLFRGLIPASVAFSNYGNGLGSLVSMAPGSVGCLIGNFPQMTTASGHVMGGIPSHMTGSYALMEPSSDQPLDLTSTGNREGYMKGKIFKTKMLKKIYNKTDNVANTAPSSKDKPTNLQSTNGMNGNAWS